jgi:hypothetical protein
MNIFYSRGFPYGAPLCMIRGGGARNAEVQEFLKAEGFRWGSRYAWENYLNRREFGAVLKTLRDSFGCTILPKDTMDSSYLIDLDSETFGRPDPIEPVPGTGKQLRRKDCKRAGTARKRAAQ